jgi:two-component system NtrC family sensor kinase
VTQSSDVAAMSHESLLALLAERDRELAQACEQLHTKIRDLQESVQFQTATSDVLKVISRSDFDLQAVLKALVGSAVGLAGAFSGAICIRDGEAFRYRAGAGPGYSEKVQRFLESAPVFPGRDSIPARVLLSGKIEEIPDVLEDTEYKIPLASLGLPARALLGVPLLGKKGIEGSLTLVLSEPGRFAPGIIERMQTFADQAVIAIQNARMFNEVQAKTHDLEESLQQQTATADVLRAISRSAFDLDTVLAMLIATAVRLCGAGPGQIFRRDGDVYRYAASQMNVDPGYLQHEEMVEIRAGQGTLIGRVALAKRAVQITDAWNDPEYEEKEAARLGNVRAMLGVPLMRGGEAIGAFALARSEPLPFSERETALVTTFADQAVIAIENARLFDEVQARTRDLTMALQQQTATADVLEVISRSAFNINPVFETVAESSVRLCGSDRALIFRFDGELLRVAAAFNAPHRLMDWLERNPIRPGRYSVGARAALERQTIHVQDVLADPEHTYGAKDVEPFRTVLGVPMLKGDDLLGVIMVYHNEVRPFTEKQIALVQTFADQAVIAIENVRLFDEVQARTKELAASLDDLRAAQDRLVQTEKLASLGQLTAGIAHEIKNPLNFVNNFAALSAELTDELNDVLKTGALNDRLQREVDELTRTLKDNLEKVVQHGKRADSIVKNMLLHSRESSGEQRPADINALLEESLNLAYHGARAEQPGFNITLQRDLDPNAGSIDVFPQEITRAFINLISNGFYAASKRKVANGEMDFEAVLSAATKNLGSHVEIRIRDNGIGIPPEVRDKIFNPFFTTKPAGEGTGLGLSMSHDIIVKQHGGRIEVDTQPGQFTEFRIFLPRAGASLIRSGERS